MTVKLMSRSTQQIVKKLDGIIAISTVSRSISPELSLNKEIIFKLISAMAIAILVEYLLIGDKSKAIVPLNWYIAGVYFFSLMLYDYYCVRTHPLNNTLKLIESIGATIYGTYILALVGNPQNLTQNPNLNTLYLVTLFFLAVGQLFYLVNYGYRTPMYATRKIFQHHRSLVIDRLSEFSPKQISLATTEIELVDRKFYRDGFANITNTASLALLLHYISILLFLPIDLPPSQLWLGVAFCLLFLGIFLSLATISAIIKDIKDNRDSDRFTQYRLIIEPYDYLVIRTHSSGIAE